MENDHDASVESDLLNVDILLVVFTVQQRMLIQGHTVTDK